MLFPGANLVSMGVVAGGDVLITADNLVEEGCISVSFQRIDNTAAGTAILTHNRCHASCRTTRSGRYMDVDHAVRRWGCATFTSVPILSGLPSGSTASGPLVQAGMVALGALSIGTCSIVSNRQSTQLMTLACLASPFITPYVFGMVQDLSTIFLEPSLARCMALQAECRRRSSQIRTQRTGACHDVVLSKQLAVELDTSQSSWWLTFKSRELEAEFVKWKAAQQAKVDDLFSAVVGCMVFVMLFAPYYVLTYSLWPSMLFFLLPCVTRSISRRWNLRNRETVMAIVAMALTFATAQVAMPMFLEVLPAARVRTLAWRMRLLGAETIIIIPLGYMVRLRTFVPLQLVLVALMATNLPRVAPILLASTSFDSASLAAQAGLALVLAAVSYSVTIPIIRALETQSRQQFLSRLVAPIA
ncbi:hypothetical protein WJX72_001193 [[Myrmecia] bisecta]|uniref:Uncharacterized protein n=1 Tax=[Myrmecia] bisecta TaxID=41462 RepID=A0AAW1R3T0_9CHLO